ncbi:DUF4340 domain-containing protein [Marinicella rhabdoformis]|uniref:DUF4340 domain-containing protein n=1 Tax=Marinicella rhabdoformis TaxID=2580566 RepID=UPI0012AEC275|nr:DUF4340 domain-containing protein [Marinicella rhabdoformis]
MLNNMKTMLGLVLVLAGLVYYLVNKDSSNGATGEGAWLLPQLQGDVTGELTALKISKGEEHLVMIKKGQQWYVEGGFYADTAPMMQLLQALRAAEKIEAKTSNPENFKQLGLGDDDLKVTLMAGEKVLAAVHLGKKATAPGASFARLGGKDQTWLVTAIDQVAFMSDDWTLKTLIDESAEQVVQVRIDNGSAAVIEINRDPISGTWSLASLPEDKQVKVDAPLLSMASGLASFTIETAMPVDLADKALKISADYQLTTGESIAVKVYQHAADYFVTMNLDKYKNWMFKIPSYKFDALNKSMSDFIEDKVESTATVETPDTQS